MTGYFEQEAWPFSVTHAVHLVANCTCVRLGQTRSAWFIALVMQPRYDEFFFVWALRGGGVGQTKLWPSKKLSN